MLKRKTKAYAKSIRALYRALALVVLLPIVYKFVYKLKKT